MGNVLNLTGKPTSSTKKLALPIARMTCSISSLIGSGYVIYHVLWSKKRRHKVFARIVLGMSANDLISSFHTFASRLPVSSDAGTRMATGTWTSCETFGFLGQGSRLASVSHNASLAFYFLLTARNRWSCKHSSSCGGRQRQLLQKQISKVHLLLYPMMQMTTATTAATTIIIQLNFVKHCLQHKASLHCLAYFIA